MDDDLLELPDVREGQDNSVRQRPSPVRETSAVYPLAPGSERQPYKAHMIKTRAFHLEIRLASADGRTPAYHDLRDIAFDGAGRHLELIFRHFIVRIRGKNLREIRLAIKNRVCDFIQEFNPQVWTRPDPDAPIIEEITFPVEDQDKDKKALS